MQNAPIAHDEKCSRTYDLTLQLVAQAQILATERATANFDRWFYMQVEKSNTALLLMKELPCN